MLQRCGFSTVKSRFIDAVAFVTLCFFISLPAVTKEHTAEKESMLESAKAGLGYLKKNRLILLLILFLAGVNLVASAISPVFKLYLIKEFDRLKAEESNHAKIEWDAKRFLVWEIIK